LRKAARIDANQPEIVATFRKLGATVDITSAVGDGFPDIIVNCFKISVKVEIKDGSKVPSKQKLTKAEKEHHDKCKGATVIINSIDQCIWLIDQMRMQADLIKIGIFHTKKK